MRELTLYRNLRDTRNAHIHEAEGFCVCVCVCVCVLASFRCYFYNTHCVVELQSFQKWQQAVKIFATSLHLIKVAVWIATWMTLHSIVQLIYARTRLYSFANLKSQVRPASCTQESNIRLCVRVRACDFGRNSVISICGQKLCLMLFDPTVSKYWSAAYFSWCIWIQNVHLN